MSDLPKISVVIPVFNSVHTIEKAILSVLNQTYSNLEVLIIDGGSTDGTVEIIKRYEPHLYYWHSKRDGSCGAAINIGLEKSTGDITSQLMADDWFEPGIFHSIARAYLANPDVEVISCGGRFVKQDAQTGELQTTTHYQTEKKMAMSIYNMCFGIPAMSSRFLTRAFINRIGILVPRDAEGKHHYSADREILLRAAVLNCKNVYVDQLGHSYFIHATSATFGGSTANRIRIYLEHMYWADRYLKEYKLSLKDKAIFYLWYNDQSVKYFFSQLLNCQWRLALQVASKGIKKTKHRWLIALFTTPLSVTVKRLFKQKQMI